MTHISSHNNNIYLQDHVVLQLGVDLTLPDYVEFETGVDNRPVTVTVQFPDLSVRERYSDRMSRIAVFAGAVVRMPKTPIHHVHG